MVWCEVAPSYSWVPRICQPVVGRLERHALCCHLTVQLLSRWYFSTIYFSSVQSFSRVRLFATPWIAARQASLSITNPRSLLRLMSIESVMPPNHLILCHPLLLLPSSIRKVNHLFAVVFRPLQSFIYESVRRENKNRVLPGATSFRESRTMTVRTCGGFLSFVISSLLLFPVFPCSD